MHLFAYGTLMFPEVWRRVVGREFRTQRASIDGYVALRAKEELFPVLLPGGANERVDGVVYFDLDHGTLARLDEFESDFYERVSVNAILDDGRPLTCQAYVLPERNRPFASNERWDATWFERESIGEYLRRINV
jgi:gamma-glutamylcyclotransferase (GGCT)/AIG2-like uncharacterized protein YtfP